MLVLVNKWQQVKLGNNFTRVWQSSSVFPNLQARESMRILTKRQRNYLLILQVYHLITLYCHGKQIRLTIVGFRLLHHTLPCVFCNFTFEIINLSQMILPLFSYLGGSPYSGVNARQIASKLQEGFRMPKPKHVDDKL